MKRVLAGASALTLVLVAGACTTEGPGPRPAAPVISSFTADRAEILPGESTTLRFTVEHAEEVEVLDGTGAPLAYEGSVSDGSVEVTPSQTTIYVLRATGKGGRTSAFVQVAVGEPLATVLLLAVPPEVDPGMPVELVWSAQGASTVELSRDDGMQVEIEGYSGVVSLTPEKSAQYTLTATGTDGETKSATAQVRVRPTLDVLEASPGVVNAGENLQFKWKTRGADEVVITEETFGEIYRSPGAAAAAEGTYSWAIPENLPGTGEPLLDGFRLAFTVTVSSTQIDAHLTRTVVRHLGHGPVIHVFDAPPYATPGREVALTWTISGAQRVQVYANGFLVSEPPVTESAVPERGGVQLPSPNLQTRYELVVSGFDGAQVRANKDVLIASEPEILDFTLPANIPAAGNSGVARWTTKNATQVQIRIKNGPVVYSTIDPDIAADGSTSVRPGRTTTYVLDAINEAGDLVSREKTVTVNNPADVEITPAHPLPGQAVTVAWNFPAGDFAEVIGVPHPVPQTNVMSGAFVDLRTAMGVNTIEFANGDDDIVELPASLAFRFPLLDSLRSRFFVSINGFIALEPSGPMPDNVELPATGRLPVLLAPLWDDLELGDGEVLYRVDGTAFPRRLIVQWSSVQLKGNPASQLDFQVQLFETGEARFIYKNVHDGGGGPVDGSATIGIHYSDAFSANVSSNTPSALQGDLELIWFNRKEPSGSFTLPMYTSSRYTLFWRRLNDEVINVSVPVTVWAKEALSVREAMPQPLVPNDTGQWIEVVNTTDEEMWLNGLSLVVASSGEYPLEDGILLQPGEAFLFGQTYDQDLSGGVRVGEAIPGLSLAAQDEVSVRIGDDVILSTLKWDASTVGESIERDQRVVNTAGIRKVCPRTATFGPAGAKGTPGGPREPCWDYVLEPVAYAPTDILASGEVLFTTPSSGRAWLVRSLAERPFPMFDRAFDEATLSMNGFIAFVTSPGTLADYYSYAIEFNPKFQIPNAAAVPFGDGLETDHKSGSTRISYVVFRRVRPGELGPGSTGHYVLQWHDMKHLNDDDVRVNFQAKLFDDGVIEFHYGHMQNGSHKTIAYGQGEDASSWVENPTGSEALVINSYSLDPGIEPYTAFRYTPVAP